MAIRIEISEEIDRPVPVVFEFYAVNHVLRRSLQNIKQLVGSEL
jgi:hypothetical protein